MDDFVLSRTGPRARDQWPGPKGGPVARAQGGPNGQGPRGAQWPGPMGGPVDRAQGPGLGQGPGPGPGTGPRALRGPQYPRRALEP